ncbi:MAG TPA: hypothetical protein VFV62_01990 [Gaiellaceae bacterium]|nr:hypothetical protein [Gaiellaceae bacterium]
MRRLVLLLSVFVSLAFSGEAMAAEVLTQDNEGRTIRFDVRAEGVDAEWYAALLRAAPHGDEISTVRIDIVNWDELHTTCGLRASGCYSRNTIVVPGDQSAENAHTVVHEYGHHLDRSTPVAGVAEPNGTPEWWRARGVAELVRLRTVATSYVLGWDRSIAELFAEDYAQLALAGSTFEIPWLEGPDESILAGLRADLGLGPAPETVHAPVIKPVSIRRDGSLAPRKRASIPFNLLGPSRRVTATATFAGAAEKLPRATLEVRCGGKRVQLKTLGQGKTAFAIDQRDLGPADCTATLASTSASTRGFSLIVRLSIVTGV